MNLHLTAIIGEAINADIKVKTLVEEFVAKLKAEGHEAHVVINEVKEVV